MKLKDGLLLRQVAGQYPSLKKRYLVLFTVCNVAFLLLLVWL